MYIYLGGVITYCVLVDLRYFRKLEPKPQKAILHELQNTEKFPVTPNHGVNRVIDGTVILGAIIHKF